MYLYFLLDFQKFWQEYYELEIILSLIGRNTFYPQE